MVREGALSGRSKARMGTWFKLGLALLLLVPTLFPLLWIVVSSLKGTAETYSFPPGLIPKTWTLEPYETVLGRDRFLDFVFNSFVVAAGATVWGVLVAAWGGYGFARYDFRGKWALLGFVLAAQSFPRILMVIPYFQIASTLGLKDNYLGLILAYSTFVQPFCIWMMKEYYASIPIELQEAALIDGCSHYGAFWRVVFPLVRPALAATAMLSFLTAWNEYEFALVLTSTEKVRTVSVGLAYFIGEFNILWNHIMAATAIATIPIVVVFLFLQKHIVHSLAAGAVKG